MTTNYGQENLFLLNSYYNVSDNNLVHMHVTTTIVVLEESKNMSGARNKYNFN